ncbi:XYN1-like protein, partial [Mya arenaria]
MTKSIFSAAHWDVNNENIHGDYFEQMTGDPNITMTMFRDTHALDPDVKLFLNDFNVMQSFSAMPLRNQAKLFKDAGVPIYGVGIQSHLKHMNLDIPTLKPNAAGLAYQQLFHTTWRTNVTDRIHGNGSSNVRGFQGVYKLTVKHGSKELAHQYFFIGKHSKTIDVNL